MELLKKEYKGIVLSTGLGIIAYLLSAFTPSSLNSILLAMLLGMIIGNLTPVPASFQSGIGFTGNKLLEISMLFLAFSIDYKHVAELGLISFSIIFMVVFIMLILSYYLAIKLKCPGASGWLIGFGTAICGSSAIAALAPTITKDKEDVGISMAVVNLFGSVGMIILPIFLVKFALDPAQMGLLLGGTLHSVGNVAGAGYSISDGVGESAITIKFARVALLSPALIFFNFLVNRKNARNWKEHFNLPWYLWSFIGITILSSVSNFPAGFTDSMETGGKIILTIAMAAIGLKVSFKKLYYSGRRGIFFGLIIFTIQIVLVSALMLFL